MSIPMKISAQRQASENVDADLLVVTLFEKQKEYHGTLSTINTLLEDFIKQVLYDEQMMGKEGETLIIHTHGKLPAKRVMVVGLGTQEKLSLETIRRAAGRVATAARTIKAKHIVTALEDIQIGELTPENASQAFVEGLMLGAYQFLKYKGQESQEQAKKSQLQECTLTVADAKQLKPVQTGIERAQLYATATMYVRDMVNTPAVEMKPKTLAQAAQHIAKQPGLTVKIYNEAAIRKLKMGSFLSVADGSDEEPYLVHLTYKPKKAATAKSKVKKIVICGKGITFDSGGLSLKPANYMETMKTDMAGAAAVLGVFSVITKLQPNIEVHGVFPATENMPSGKATRPGDVVKAYNGKTIEVVNTDAEGRLVLADALAWAEETIKPDYMIDLATLTGAAIVALGQEVAPMYSTDKQLLNWYTEASKQAGEQAWEMPFIEEYRDLLNSPIADLQNVTKLPWAGSVTGALFLSNFVKKTPWMHVDIAGPAFAEKQVLPYAPFGGTGYGVRTLLQLLSNF